MNDLKWWQKAVFYQIYPRSFADSNGDGIGDLPGIVDRLGYLQELGVDAIWLSPQYPSPMWDCGYDISDYRAIAPEYGTLSDFKRLLDGLHERGMRLILDLVLNHTSDQHPWFIESRSSRTNPRRDWYIWKDGKGNGPPNNWYSKFGGSAWELDPQTGQYYYHFFFKQQPDLNWRNPQVQEAMFDVVRYWLDMGVDGFRLDAIATLFEDESLGDQESGVTQADIYRLGRAAHTSAEQTTVLKLEEQLYRPQIDLPEVHDIMRKLRQVVDEYPDRVLVGETDMLEYLGNGQDELNLVFNFPLMHTNHLTPEWVRANQKLRIEALPPGSWPCNTLGNHDSSRVASHFGDGIHDRAIEQIALALMLTLWGTPFLYYGEEIGMTDLMLHNLHRFKDMLGVWAHEMEIQLVGSSPEAALAYADRVGRDKCRTPMQWSDSPNAGFSPAGVETWLPTNPNYREGVNVADQAEDPESLLSFYRNLIRVRKTSPALISGTYIPIKPHTAGYLAFLRQDLAANQTCLVVINFAGRAFHIDFSELAEAGRLVFSSRIRSEAPEPLDRLLIAPFEIYIAALEGLRPTRA